MALTRAAIAAAKDLKIESMNAPAWADDSGDDVVHVREMTAHMRQRYGEMFLALKNAQGQVTRLPDHYHAVVAAMGLCDENGELFYDWQDSNDIAELSEKGETVIEVSKRVLHISGLDGEAEAVAEKK